MALLPNLPIHRRRQASQIIGETTIGADIHMVLEKRVLPPGMMPGNEVWLGVNAFPYVTTTIYDFSRRDRQVRAAGAGGSGPNAPQVDVEVAFTGSTHWPPTSRNYDLFGALAGVRRPGPEPRGIPTDASLLALHMIASWGEDGHSHTWHTMDEALPIFIQHSQFGDPGAAVLKAMQDGTSKVLDEYMRYFWSLDDEDTLADYRLISWFDN